MSNFNGGTMFGSDGLEVAMSLIFIYVLLSVVCSSLNELLGRLLATRSKMLEEGILNLLGKPELVQAFYEHPLVKSLAKQTKFDQLIQRPARSSYIPDHVFALALINVITSLPIKTPENDISSNTQLDQLLLLSEAERFNLLKERISKPLNSNNDLYHALLILIGQANTMTEAQQNIEQWFNDTMDRVSGWYKRKVQLAILIIATVLAVSLNVDTIVITQSLWQNNALRTAIVVMAETSLNKGAIQLNEPASLESVQGDIKQLQLLNMPLGWVPSFKAIPNPTGETGEYWVRNDDPRAIPTDIQGIIQKILGLTITIMAISLGAPFWFDLLSKITELRASGVVPTKSPTPN